jgi:hypothetical protein
MNKLSYTRVLPDTLLSKLLAAVITANTTATWPPFHMACGGITVARAQQQKAHPASNPRRSQPYAPLTTAHPGRAARSSSLR